jgi:hypothetical protein
MADDFAVGENVAIEPGRAEGGMVVHLVVRPALVGRGSAKRRQGDMESGCRHVAAIGGPRQGWPVDHVAGPPQRRRSGRAEERGEFDLRPVGAQPFEGRRDDVQVARVAAAAGEHEAQRALAEMVKAVAQGAVARKDETRFVVGEPGQKQCIGRQHDIGQRQDAGERAADEGGQARSIARREIAGSAQGVKIVVDDVEQSPRPGRLEQGQLAVVGVAQDDVAAACAVDIRPVGLHGSGGHLALHGIEKIDVCGRRHGRQPPRP